MQREGGREGGPLATRYRHCISLVTGAARARTHAARARLQPFRNMCEVAPKLVAAITCTRVEINAVDS